MEIDSLRIDIRKSDFVDDCLVFRTTVQTISCLGKEIYQYERIIGRNDFDDLFSIMMDYAEHEIKEVVNKHHIAKLKQIKARK